MYKMDYQKTSGLSSDLLPPMTSEPKSMYRPKKSDLPSNAFGVSNFSSVSILPRDNGSVQTKLKINSPGDKYEQEADAIADKVMQSPAKTVQRECSKCKEEEHSIQTKSNGGAANTASSGFTNNIQSAQGGGFGLDASTRGFMESQIGGDFSKVKIHADSRAARLNQEINARAFTLNNNIYFNKGEYAPNDIEGKRLLAHELVHTVQQTGSGGLIQKADKDDKKKKDKKKDVKHEMKVEVVRETDLKKGKTETKASTTQSAEEKVDKHTKVKATNKTTAKDRAGTAEVKVTDKKSGVSLGAGVKGTETFAPGTADKADAFVKISGKWTLLDRSYLKLTTEPTFKLSTDKGPQFTLDGKAVLFPNGTLSPEVAAKFLFDKKGFTGEAKTMLNWQMTDYLSAQAGVTFTLNPQNKFSVMGGVGIVLHFK